jgi:hypothetical protein
MRYTILLFSVLSLFLNACSGDFFEQTIEIDPPEYQKKLVVHCYFGIGDTLDLLATVQRNFGLLDVVEADSFGIHNATVSMLKDGQVQFFLQNSGEPGDWFYRANVPPTFFVAGGNYGLRVERAGFPTVEATQVMPAEPKIDSARYRPNDGISNDGDKLMGIDVFLKDTPGERNYYAISATTEVFYTFPIFDNQGNIIDYDTSFYQYPLYPIASDDPNAELTDAQVLVSDQFFDGQSYKLNLKSERDQGGLTQRFRVTVRAVTEDYYLNVITSQRKSDTNDTPLVEPVLVHSNMQNGIGVFALYAAKVILVE